MHRKKQVLTAKDLITTGIFCALFFIVTIISGMFFAPNPVLTFLTPIAMALLTGGVYMLMVAKVPKRGPTIILGIVMGIMMFVTGMFWLWSIAYIVLGVIAGEIARIGQYKSLRWNTVSFMVFSLNPLASYVMLWVNRQSYRTYLESKGTDPAYMDAMFQTAQDWLLPAMLFGTLATAWIGAYFGRYLLKKHFEKAGIA